VSHQVNGTLQQPDHFFVGSERQIEIVPQVAADFDTVQVAINAETITKTWYVQVGVAEESDEMPSALSACVTGLADNVKLITKSIDGQDQSQLKLELVDDPFSSGKKVYAGVFSTFGFNSKAPEIVLSPQTKSITKTLSLSDALVTEDATERQWIILDDAVGPDDFKRDTTQASSGSMWQPYVEDWEHETIKFYI